MEWIFKKWDEEGRAIDLEQTDSNGHTPLMAVCVKGYLGSEQMAGRLYSTKKKRLETVKLLIKKGANIDVEMRMTKYTALHWAAYNDDPNVVAHLLASGA